MKSSNFVIPASTGSQKIPQVGMNCSAKNFRFQRTQNRLVLFFFVAFLSGVANAEGDVAKLNSVLNQITSVKTDIVKKERKQISIKQQLNDLKKKTNTVAANLKETTRKLRLQKKILAKLTKERAYQQLKLKTAQNRLLSQLNLSYQIERRNYLKVILGEEKGIRPDLILAYHKYIFVAHLEQMRDIKKSLEHLEQNRKKIKKETQELEKLEKKQKQQQLELEKSKNEYNQVLGSLKNRIAKQNRRLKQLLIAKRNLEELLDKLTPSKPTTISQESRIKFCKNFIWPTQGPVIIHFDSPIEQSSWKWNGVIISAPLNQKVCAVAAGSVVYSGWLAGYGLLLIIDHENGYMSLYGYNKVLRKKLDDKVEKGEVISTVGESNHGESELYFAIRYNGKPIDPEKWCR